jgi:hypothetical protein
MQSGWLKCKHSAAYADVSERTIRTWLKCGLRHVRPNGGAILIKIEWLDEFLESFESSEDETQKIVEEVMSEL